MMYQCLFRCWDILNGSIVATKKNFRASFTSVVLHVLEYRWTTKVSIASISFSMISSGDVTDDSLINTGVISSSIAHHVSKNPFLPFPDMTDVVSQPLNAWKNGRVYDQGSQQLRVLE